jgi:hypothetical protein
MAFDWTTFWFVVIIGVLIIAFVLVLLWYLSLSRKKKQLPSHIELYFDENFRKIMDEWDFTTRDRVKDFKKDMGKRLTKVGNDISTLENRKASLDRRISAVERGMEKLEGA